MLKALKFLLLLLISATCSFAQTKSVNIQHVENGLIPYVPVKGFPSWNIYERMKFYNVKGVSIAIVHNFKIDWAKGYGLADTANHIPVSAKTMFSAGSISKFLAAAVALRLVQAGKLQLDSPINHYLTSWKIGENAFTHKTPITLRMLLSHTAGTSQSAYFGFTPDKTQLPTIVQVLNGEPIAESRPVVVNSEPGKDFRYSGGGYMIAQMAMMDVSGNSFATLAQKELFDPLEMKNATFEQPLPGKYIKQASWGYSAAPWYKGKPYVYPQQAAAGLYATPTDLAKFVIGVQQSLKGKSRLLNQQIAQQMIQPQATVSEGGYKEQIGTGPFILQLAGNRHKQGLYFEFTGVNAGFVAYLIGNAETGDGAVIMLNSGDDNNGLGMEIRRAIAQTYNWYHFLPNQVKPVKLKDSIMDEYTGRYRKGADEVVYINREEDHLVERINNGRPIYCFPIAKDSVVLTDFNVKACFKRDIQGKVTGLQTAYQDKPLVKMKSDEFTPAELLKQKKYKDAIAGYRAIKLNEYQLTYMVYDLLNTAGFDQEAAMALLKLAQELYPQSAIVYSRWGDYYLKLNDKANALISFKKANELQPGDAGIEEKIKLLEK